MNSNQGDPMLIKIQSILVISISILFTACSSYPESAEGVAKAVCLELKKGSFDQLEQYVAPEEKASFKESFAKSEKFLQSSIAKNMFATMQCDKNDGVQIYDGDRQKFSFGQMKIKVFKQQNRWYFTN